MLVDVSKAVPFTWAAVPVDTWSIPKPASVKRALDFMWGKKELGCQAGLFAVIGRGLYPFSGEDMETALNDEKANPRRSLLYAVSVALRQRDATSAYDWIPGDASGIPNPDPQRPPGLEGENLLYRGSGEFFGLGMKGNKGSLQECA